MTIQQDSNIRKHYEGMVDEAALLATALRNTSLNDDEQATEDTLNQLIGDSEETAVQEPKKLKVSRYKPLCACILNSYFM